MFPCVFFFNDTATTEIYTLSLHDALPILRLPVSTSAVATMVREPPSSMLRAAPKNRLGRWRALESTPPESTLPRSEEHTSELQSHLNLVCRLLLEKKKKNYNRSHGLKQLL